MYSKMFFTLAEETSEQIPMATLTLSDTHDYGGASLGSPYNDFADSHQPVFVIEAFPASAYSPALEAATLLKHKS
jgi:hypothetical protein